MGAAVPMEQDVDVSNVPFVLRTGAQLGVITALFVLALSFATRFLTGAAETGVVSLLLLVGIGVHVCLPGIWTRPRTVEGISAAAGIGLWSTVVFLFIDVILLQNIGTYTNRWLAIGGGSNWWHHPVWWHVGTYLPWMGAFIMANQAVRGGTSVAKVLGLVYAITAVVGALAAMVHFPGAGFNVPTFGIAVLPALAIATGVSSLGPRQA